VSSAYIKYFNKFASPSISEPPSISGLLELKIVIAALVRSFDFGLTETKITQNIAMSLQPFADGKLASMPLKVSLAQEL
jgi:hypothetical protein